MKREDSSEAAELDADHRDVDPRRGAGFGGFVIAHESPLVHQPAEGSLHDPAAQAHGIGFVPRAQAGLLAGGGVFAVINTGALKQDEPIFHVMSFGS